MQSGLLRSRAAGAIDHARNLQRVPARIPRRTDASSALAWKDADVHYRRLHVAGLSAVYTECGADILLRRSLSLWLLFTMHN